MTEERHQHADPRRFYRSMQPRRRDEAHRPATPLELLFDLCYVAAVAVLVESLHHRLTEGDLGSGILPYVTVFFGIWWGWVNFTWFASAYDADDGPYRIATFVQMGGVLVLAAGVPRAFEDGDFLIIVTGYVIMRLALVSLWLRAAHGDPIRRKTALRFASGVTLIQAGWVGLLLLPDDLVLPVFFVLAAMELVIPIWAENAERTPWHPQHIAERYGLFTIIVIGESVISTTRAFQVALDAGEDKLPLIAMGACSLIIVTSCWWLYFDRQRHDRLSSTRRVFTWGYGHYFIFASLAAIGGGLAAAVDDLTGHSSLDAIETGYTIAVPLAIYILSLWYLQVLEYETERAGAVFLAAAGVMLLLPLSGLGVYVLGPAMAVLVLFDQLVAPGAPLHGHAGEPEPG